MHISSYFHINVNGDGDGDTGYCSAIVAVPHASVLLHEGL